MQTIVGRVVRTHRLTGASNPSRNGNPRYSVDVRETETGIVHCHAIGTDHAMNYGIENPEFAEVDHAFDLAYGVWQQVRPIGGRR